MIELKNYYTNLYLQTTVKLLERIETQLSPPLKKQKKLF